MRSMRELCFELLQVVPVRNISVLPFLTGLLRHLLVAWADTSTDD